MKKYQIIYADPPWHYNDKRVSITSDRPQKYGGITYPVMTTRQICDLPIKSITDETATLFLWATMPVLEDSFEVIHSWGFRYATCGFTWVKINKSKDNAMFLTENDIRSGLGSYTNSNAELCLIGVKGNCLPRLRKDIKQVVLAPVIQHSEKPPEVRERIVALYGDLPRIELFARKKVEGWDCWGNEVDSDIDLTVKDNSLTDWQGKVLDFDHLEPNP